MKPQSFDGDINVRKTVYLEIVLPAPSYPMTIAGLRETKPPSQINVIFKVALGLVINIREC